MGPFGDGTNTPLPTMHGGKGRRKREIDYDINIRRAPPPPPNPFQNYPIIDPQPGQMGRLARRERWILAPLARLWQEPAPVQQQTRSGRIIKPPERLVMPVFRQEGSHMVEDKRWYGQDDHWERDMVPSDVEAPDRDSAPPSQNQSPEVPMEEEHSLTEDQEAIVRGILEEQEERQLSREERRVVEQTHRFANLLENMGWAEQADPTWLGLDEGPVFQYTSLPSPPRLSPQARRRRQSAAKYGK